MSSAEFYLETMPGHETIVETSWSKLDLFRKLRNDLSRAIRTSASKEEFRQLLVRAQTLLEAGDDEIASRIRTSRPTIGRWTSGVSCPRPATMNAVFTTLEAWVQQRVNHYQSMQSKKILPPRG